ncbi:hypothetical protein [Bradyrhizobium sp. LHD-71]|uniref:hypothetical protein n=1 Tax=Bradyrhizobium sp. LHD-71 TaxID=3072141 RepID=UPI0028109B81|nr:hypothetical protein [Bradyrhizobium sp. LHD-71]MDQ8727958.1 hypothetical protein [Bradyrhizobium sp. LHD-71]
MTYLDVSPMMVALRAAPEEFEMQQGWLRHIPSQHDFLFDPEGRVQIRAQCNCAFLSVEPSQARDLASHYNDWQKKYWQPLLINREFASHFHHSAFRKMLIDFTGWLHRRLMQQSHADHSHGLGKAYPAE